MGICNEIPICSFINESSVIGDSAEDLHVWYDNIDSNGLYERKKTGMGLANNKFRMSPMALRQV